eukprot:CFRG7041T1
MHVGTQKDTENEYINEEGGSESGTETDDVQQRKCKRDSISSLSDSPHSTSSSTRSSRHSGTISIEPYRMRVAEDYEGGDENILSAKVGEVVWVLLDLEPQWYTVANEETFGFLPAMILEPYVEGSTPVTRMSSSTRYPTYPPQDVCLEGYALYDFVARDQSELSFSEGDSIFRVLAVSESYTDPNWIYVELSNGNGTGWVPKEYVVFSSATVLMMESQILATNVKSSRRLSKNKDIESQRALSPVEESVASQLKKSKVTSVTVGMITANYDAQGKRNHLTVYAGEVCQCLSREGEFCLVKLFVRIGEGLVPTSIVIENNAKSIEASNDDNKTNSSTGLGAQSPTSARSSRMSTIRKTFRLGSPLTSNTSGKQANSSSYIRNEPLHMKSNDFIALDGELAGTNPSLGTVDSFLKTMSRRTKRRSRPNSTGTSIDKMPKQKFGANNRNLQTMSDPSLPQDDDDDKEGVTLSEILQDAEKIKSKHKSTPSNKHSYKKQSISGQNGSVFAGTVYRQSSNILESSAHPPSIPNKSHPRKMSTTELLRAVLKEIVNTEETYVKDLRTIHTFFEFLTATVKFGLLCDIQKCIAELKEMIECHTKFIEIIRFPDNESDDTGRKAVARIADGFVAFADQFKKYYSVYCVFYPQVLASWMPYETSPEGLAAMETYKMQNDVPNLNVQSLIIKPVQRVCKYHLLLAQLLRYSQNKRSSSGEIQVEETVETDSGIDIGALQNCLSVMKGTADYINEIKRKKDMEDISSDLFANVNGWEGLAPSKMGLLMYHDKVQIDGTKSRKITNASLYVFQNAIVVCAPNTQNRRKESVATIKSDNIIGPRGSRKTSVDFFPAYTFSSQSSTPSLMLTPPSTPNLGRSKSRHDTHPTVTNEQTTRTNSGDNTPFGVNQSSIRSFMNNTTRSSTRRASTKDIPSSIVKPDGHMHATKLNNNSNLHNDAQRAVGQNSSIQTHQTASKRLKFVRMLLMSCVDVQMKVKASSAPPNSFFLKIKRGERNTSAMLVSCRTSEAKSSLAQHINQSIIDWGKKNLVNTDDEVLSFADMLASSGDDPVPRPPAQSDMKNICMAQILVDWAPPPGCTHKRAIDVKSGDFVRVLRGSLPENKQSMVAVQLFGHVLREGVVPASTLQLWGGASTFKPPATYKHRRSSTSLTSTGQP